MSHHKLVSLVGESSSSDFTSGVRNIWIYPLCFQGPVFDFEFIEIRSQIFQLYPNCLKIGQAQAILSFILNPGQWRIDQRDVWSAGTEISAKLVWWCSPEFVHEQQVEQSWNTLHWAYSTFQS